MSKDDQALLEEFGQWRDDRALNGMGDFSVATFIAEREAAANIARITKALVLLDEASAAAEESLRSLAEKVRAALLEDRDPIMTRREFP